MSRKLIDHSPDLKRLVDQGYTVSIKGGYVVIADIPYVDPDRNVQRGVLVSRLESDGQKAVKPSDHVVYFVGAHPCKSDGTQIGGLGRTEARVHVAEGLDTQHQFSARPTDPNGFLNYYDKIANYVALIYPHARKIEPAATPKMFRPVTPADDEETVFKYVDTASSRANIVALSEKLKQGRLAIVGLGGTGSYVLDLIAKTHVPEIHLFDGDRLLAHNAFRAPGAVPLEKLVEQPTKVAYHSEVYGAMRDGIIAHEFFIGSDSLNELDDMDFVFLCMEGDVKKSIVQHLEARKKAFIDVGMGLFSTGDAIGGTLRVTTSMPEQREHVHAKHRIPLGERRPGQEYEQNIQIADLNALNAALAVIKWKKLCGFYGDLKNEFHSTYTVVGNLLLNEDIR
ncbi:MAG TPA: ThiF family adenylyltransferase [Candidatus Elarobacter sp.]|jgi:hypothetical protein|nr:ThiF family adenylyltransferase [Candidatus Elarobacter sp.]